MRASARIGVMGSMMVGVAAGCMEPPEAAPGVDAAWALEARSPGVDEWTTLPVWGLGYAEGRGGAWLEGSRQATLLHGAYAQRVRVDVGELSASWVDWSRFGSCARTLTFEVDEVTVGGDPGVVEAAELEASAIEVVTHGVGSATVRITGRLVEAVADDEAGARGRGRGRGGEDAEAAARCAETFAAGADLGLVYTLEVDVVEAAGVAITPRSQCAAPGEDVRMVEEGDEVFGYRLEGARGESLSGVENWSGRIGMWAGVPYGEGSSARVDEQGDRRGTLSVGAAPGELTAGAGETAERFGVEVVPEEEVGAFELGFWYVTRGFTRVGDGGTFWTYAVGEHPALRITLEELEDRRGAALCGDGLGLEFSSRTPEVCEVRAAEPGGLWEARALDYGVFFARDGECTIEVRAPGADGGRGLARVYTFTKRG
jgi:hypothetical protein